MGLFNFLNSPKPRILPIKMVLLPGTKKPEYSRKGDVGCDLFARLDHAAILAPGEFAKIPTGVMMAIPFGWEGQVRPRSGSPTRGHFVNFGTVDPNYRGEIMVGITNISKGLVTVENHEKIAQLLIAPWTEISFQEERILDDTNRGEQGFGSSGRF